MHTTAGTNRLIDLRLITIATEANLQMQTQTPCLPGQQITYGQTNLFFELLAATPSLAAPDDPVAMILVQNNDWILIPAGLRFNPDLEVVLELGDPIEQVDMPFQDTGDCTQNSAYVFGLGTAVLSEGECEKLCSQSDCLLLLSSAWFLSHTRSEPFNTRL